MSTNTPWGPEGEQPQEHQPTPTPTPPSQDTNPSGWPASQPPRWYTNPAQPPQPPSTPSPYPYPYAGEYPPAGYAPVPPARPTMGDRMRRLTWKHWTGIGCLALLLLTCGFCGLAGLAGSVAGGGNTTNSGSGGTSLTATATAKPTNTPDPNAGWQHYRDIVTADSTTLATDFTNISNSCGSGDASQLGQCRDDLVTADDDIKAFQKDLKDNPAPPCLSAADKLLKSGLSKARKGVEDTIKGIDNYDVSLVDQGSSELTAGSKDFTKASGAVDKATCS